MINLSKMHKRIVGVAFSFLALSLVTVHAEDVNWCTDSDTPADIDVSQRYGISLTSLGNNQYEVKMNPSSNRTDRCKMTFHITKINDKDVSGYTLSCDQSVVFTENETANDTTYGLPGIVVKVESDDKIIKNENETNSCYYGGGSVTLEISAPISEEKSDESCPPIQAEDATLTVPAINCNDFYEPGSFEAKFCYAKNHAEKSLDFTSTGGKYTDGYSSFKCNYDINSIPTDPKDLEGDKYYLNKNYLYGHSTETITFGSYQFHYSPGSVTEGNAITCDVTCEEAVEVEYGPPVASKAGMCFEYKVRVTSRTSCNMSKAPEMPPHDCSYCNPTPRCVSSGGGIWLQGGPNEEFDACVKACDGGKYTKSCSNKCYKKVYGTTANAKVSYSFMDDTYGTKLAYTGSMDDCKSINKIGCYYKENDTIFWEAGPEPSRGGEGRWYAEHPDGKYHNGKYTLDGQGFWRHVYSNGTICHDTCSWIGCEGDVYLNPGMGGKDYTANMELYNEAVKSCKSRATCTTTTAEFTITADYIKGSNDVSVNFPYDSQKDTITHTTGGVNDTTSMQNTTLLPDEVAEDNTSMKTSSAPYATVAANNGLLGCYKKDDSRENLYRSTWSFPGTWINLKTGEISFTPKNTDNTSWKEREHKFCIPNDAMSVNAAWWNQYYRKTIADHNIKSTITESTVVDSKCQKTIQNTIYDPGIVIEPDRDIKWNISAKTNKFGYFGWLIEMKCFYALNPHPATPTISTETVTVDKECDPDPDNYRVRSIDLENVFPATDGSHLEDTNASGRAPGFNWSSFATNLKNLNYTSNPEAYMKKIQGKGYGIYSNDNLDYEFYLSPKTIRSMRSDSSDAVSGTNYTNFDESGFFVDTNGVARYKSSKIRGLGSNKIANDQAITCNNMIRYDNTSCEAVE